MGSNNSEEQWATAIVVFLVGLAIAVVVTCLRILPFFIGWLVKVYKQHWPNAALKWSIFGWLGAFILSLLSGAGWLVVLSSVAWVLTVAVVDSTLRQPEVADSEVTIEHLLSEQWHEDDQAS